jgi:hypothetical protein
MITHFYIITLTMNYVINFEFHNYFIAKKTHRQTNYYASLTQKKYADLIQTVLRSAQYAS